MTDLVDFLLARITEDRARAQAAKTPVEILDDIGLIYESSGHWLVGWNGDYWADDAVEALKGAVTDPARVLAECEAKQRLVTALSEGLAKHWGPREDPEREWEWCPKARTAEFCEGTDLEWGPDAPCECSASSPDYLQEPLLRLFTLPYADHPDYREEWKPPDDSKTWTGSNDSPWPATWSTD